MCFDVTFYCQTQTIGITRQDSYKFYKVKKNHKKNTKKKNPHSIDANAVEMKMLK